MAAVGSVAYTCAHSRRRSNQEAARRVVVVFESTRSCVSTHPRPRPRGRRSPVHACMREKHMFHALLARTRRVPHAGARTLDAHVSASRSQALAPSHSLHLPRLAILTPSSRRAGPGRLRPELGSPFLSLSSRARASDLGRRHRTELRPCRSAYRRRPAWGGVEGATAQRFLL